VNGNKEREITWIIKFILMLIWCLKMTNLWQGSKNFLQFTINVKNLTTNLNALWNSYAKIVCFSSELIAFRYAGSSIQNAREQFVSCIHISFTNFAQTHKQKYNTVRSEESNSSISVAIQNYTHVHMNFLSHNGRYCHLPKYWLQEEVKVKVQAS
jgi:hypothetical protein